VTEYTGIHWDQDEGRSQGSTVKRITLTLCIGLAASAFIGLPTWAGENPDSKAKEAEAKAPPGESAEVTPVLQPDPKVAKILDGLAAGHCAVLPKAKVTGDLNAVARKYGLDETGPGGRNFCVKMMWMPDRMRAIYCGANHGRPHRLNDVWEYDLAANTWVCLYGPDLSKDGGMAHWKDTKLKDGVLVTERGGPAVIGHQWWQLDYDDHRRTLYFLSRWSILPKQIRQEYFRSGKVTHEPPLWAFDPYEKAWRPVHTKKQPALRVGLAVYFHYVPSLKKFVYVDAGWRVGGMWLYDADTTVWKRLHGGEEFKAKNNPASPIDDGVMVYDKDRDLLIASSWGLKRAGGRTVRYDVVKDSWQAVAEGPDVPRGHSSFTPCGYDSAAKVMLLYEPRSRVTPNKEHRLWAFDPAEGKWSRISPKGPFPPHGNGKAIGYYDPARNVFVIDRNGSIWVYRHQAAAKASPLKTDSR
jgi:hypothetical protein